MFVVTMDQVRSRSGDDLVPAFMADLIANDPQLEGASQAEKERFVDRTAGDEVQVLVDTPQRALSIVRRALRDSAWHIGLGVGHAEIPEGEAVRVGRGEAFVNARKAVDRAKTFPAPGRVAVVAADEQTAKEAEALLRLLALAIGPRSREAWEVIDIVEAKSLTYSEIGKKLGITQQAVSQRMRAARWSEEQAALPLALRLLSALR